jgi:hypothetical protein
MIPQLGIPHQPLGDGVHAFLMPAVTRRVDLRVIFSQGGRREVKPDGTVAILPDMELAPAAWLPMPEGEWSGLPFLSSGQEDRCGAMAVLQAMVDLGHRLGLTPSGTEDRTAEVSALRYHLEDMRKLVGVRSTEPASRDLRGR